MVKHEFEKIRVPDGIWTEPTTLRDLVGCSNHWATGDYGDEGTAQFVGLDWNHTARIHSQVMSGTCKLTNSIPLSHCYLKHLETKRFEFSWLFDFLYAISKSTLNCYPTRQGWCPPRNQTRRHCLSQSLCSFGTMEQKTNHSNIYWE